MQWRRNVFSHYLKCLEWWYEWYSLLITIAGVSVQAQVYFQRSHGSLGWRVNVLCVLIGSCTFELSFFYGFLLWQWKIFLRQSNEKIRLQLVCPSSNNNLPLPLYSSAAGAALMDISEVHKRVHLELEENVSAKRGGRIKVLSLVCRCTVSPLLDAFSKKLLLCMFTCGSVYTLLPHQSLSSSSFIEVEQRKGKLVKERKGTGFGCWVTCCVVTFLENSRQALTCPWKTALTITLGASRWQASILHLERLTIYRWLSKCWWKM